MIRVSVGWGGLIVAVMIPRPPAAIRRLAGSRDVMVAAGSVPVSESTRKLPGLLVMRTSSVFTERRLTRLWKALLWCEKSPGPAAILPLMRIVALLTR